MHDTPDGLVFSPSDLNRFIECEYLSRLDVDVARGRVLQRHRSAEADLLAAKGEAHEREHLARLRADGRDVIEITDPASEADWSIAARATLAAMEAGAGAIYQAVLMEPGWRGRADFLVRVETPSALGGWSYEVWDTKLARRAKPSHILQLAYYSSRVAAAQGLAPAWMHVILGTDEEVRFRCEDFEAYYRAVRRRFERAVADGLAGVSPYPVGHCTVCDYAQHCQGRWEAQDHLTRVAGIRRSQVERLEESGVATCARLAALEAVPQGMGEAAFERLRHQAALQTHFRMTGEHRYELLVPGEDNGFRLLPPPSAGDIFFDMEGYPYFEPAGGLEYLFGALILEDCQERFAAFRATDRAGEKRAFEQFVEFVWKRLRSHPDLHVYHYSHYEPTALKRLAAIHGTREEQIDELLRREAFVDLYQIVRRAVRISHASYSIKAVRQFFMPEAGQGQVTAGAQSILEFARWLETGDATILDAIERYNQEDCVSTLRLRDWLLDRKRECEGRFGADIPFATLPVQREQPVETEPVEHAELRGQLEALEDTAASLLGHLLGYHRREAKPEWWAYFQRRKKSQEELLDDTEAIAGLEPVGEPVARDQSLVYTLRFPPQEFKLKADSPVEAPLGGPRAGIIEWIDGSRGLLGLRRGKKRHGEPLPSALVLGGPIPDTAQRRAVARVAEAAVSGHAGRYRAVFDLLRRTPPRVAGRAGRIQTLDLAEQVGLVEDLDDSYLFLQGPPGSGKTWTGARLIVALLRAGKRVGVAGPSHRAVHNLLEAVEAVAGEQRVTFVGLKKRSASDETAFEGRFITSAASNEDCEGSEAQLVAGTPWLFARERLDRAFDVLFIDEAGQVALADAIAVGTAARSLVLLGDPQQLPHVTHHTHPEGAGCSVLEHLLRTSSTVGEDRGIFLAASWRMHPSVCRFVSELSYESRLVSAPGCERQRADSAGLTGSGLRFVAVEHRHNAQRSQEEADTIAADVRTLLRDGTVADRDGRTRPIEAGDILVVAPYNMQVRCLREVLPEGVDVGTVDKFQGREAAVVFFSMTTSSGEDVPRGLEFLLNRNRFNVAISRAKCLSVVVCSPRLLESRCASVEQMRLVNALCAFAECAGREQPSVEPAGIL